MMVSRPAGRALLVGAAALATTAAASLGATAGAAPLGLGHAAAGAGALSGAARHVGVVQVSGTRTAWHTNQSNNWSGYNQGSLEQGGKLFSSISGQWVVPTATQHTADQAEYSASWIGIGGGCVDANCLATDSTLIQAGTEQDVSSSGAASYSTWYELIPAPSVSTPLKVSPGDTVSVSIAQSAPEVWAISMKDVTTGQSWSTTVPYTSTMDTAEWIEETPLTIGTSGAGLAAMPNLGTVHFDLAKVNGSAANLTPAEEMQLTSSSGQVLATPSAPDPDVDGFNDCTFATTCAAPTSS